MQNCKGYQSISCMQISPNCSLSTCCLSLLISLLASFSFLSKFSLTLVSSSIWSSSGVFTAVMIAVEKTKFRLIYFSSKVDFSLPCTIRNILQSRRNIKTPRNFSSRLLINTMSNTNDTMMMIESNISSRFRKNEHR